VSDQAVPRPVDPRHVLRQEHGGRPGSAAGLEPRRSPLIPERERRVLARALASELAPKNIRVNVVSSGSIDTSRANPERYQGRVPDTAGIPLGRQGTADEIAATCLFLVTDDSGFITGQTIHANGGVAYY
jgi:hypothetical protein